MRTNSGSVTHVIRADVAIIAARTFSSFQKTARGAAVTAVRISVVALLLGIQDAVAAREGRLPPDRALDKELVRDHAIDVLEIKVGEARVPLVVEDSEKRPVAGVLVRGVDARPPGSGELLVANALSRNARHENEAASLVGRGIRVILLEDDGSAASCSWMYPAWSPGKTPGAVRTKKTPA
jgi:hypothetical protein